MRDNNKLIGLLMREKRLTKRMSLQQVADQLGNTKQMVSKWELGKTKITVDDLKAFCSVVGCSWIDLLNRVSDEVKRKAIEKRG